MAFVYIFSLTVQIIFLYGDGSDDDGSITEVVEFVGTVDAIAIASAISNRENPSPSPPADASDTKRGRHSSRLPPPPIQQGQGTENGITPNYDSARELENQAPSNLFQRTRTSRVGAQYVTTFGSPRSPGDRNDARLRVDLAPIVGLP